MTELSFLQLHEELLLLRSRVDALEKQSPSKIQIKKEHWTLFFDGACEPRNPGGHGSYGWILKDTDGNTVAENSGYLGRNKGMTNNIAEFAGLLAGLTYLSINGPKTKLHIKGDSKLVVNLISGKWNAHAPHICDLVQKTLNLLDKVATAWWITWIPREKNVDADILSKSADYSSEIRVF